MFRLPMPVLLAFWMLMIAVADAPAEEVSYPPSRKSEVVDLYHGVRVADPFRWLEDDNAEETKAWVKEQNALTFSWLEKIPQRGMIRRRLEKLWNYERFGMPFRRGGRYFFTRNSGLQNQSVLYVAESLEAAPRELLDPNRLSEDGTVSLSTWEPSEDGRLLVYGLSRAGSDWQEFRIRDVGTGEDLRDVLHWIKFSGASWAKDGSGFYYGRYPEPEEGAALTGQNKNKRICFHQVGDAQDQDEVVYARRDEPEWGFDATVTDDGRYLILEVGLGTDPKNRIYYKDLSRPDAPVVKLLDDFDATYAFVDNVGPVFYFHTDLGAPRYRVIAVDLSRPERGNWREIVPQKEEKLDHVSLTGGRFFCKYLRHAASAVRVHELDGAPLGEVALPGIGSVYGFGGRRDETETFYSFTSFVSPGVIYRYDIPTGRSTVYRKPELDFDGALYETTQAFVTSRDGVRVPVFITCRKGLVKDGSHPCLLYGYGGFNISLTPGFSISRAVWLEMGGIHVTANLRGGGEYGAQWHLDGVRLKKQNGFDDFLAVAQWLIDSGYTQACRLAIQGGSNGGLLVGACMTQRPELFGAALPAVGVMDMLRFHKFTIGWAWTSDYGSSDDPEQFKALYAYSPLHNLQPGTRYPATLVTTADHDDRVVPAHSFKFAARLQECQAKDGPPVLIRIQTSAGHGAGTALDKVIEETADQWAFLVRALQMEALSLP